MRFVLLASFLQGLAGPSQDQPVLVKPYLAPGAAFDEERGLTIERMVLPDGGVIEYERPPVLLPASLVPGEIHESQRRFVRRSRGGEKLDVGAHYFEAELLRMEDLEGYEGCLVVRRRAVRMDFSGGKETVDVTEWYAKGVGLVKASGERVAVAADGTVLSRETIATEP